ncbi:MAG: pyridoxamine 5'-phosphate oxidase [Bacteroidetes bacterium]|nr:pyridoxamine 5'-phosphate oxidase [Bacteroidota bacterium]
MNIDALRREYQKGELKDDHLDPDPMHLFEKWFEQALHADIFDPNAMTLATADLSGRPSARIVLLKKFDEKGFYFFTNYTSRKGSELDKNPLAALLIFWKELERQVRIEGAVKRTTRNESDQYFHSRSLESRISAAISPQSKVVESRRFLEDRWVEYLKEIKDKDVKRPDFWGGFRLIPDSIEFWQGRPNRLHDRILYKRTGKAWEIVRLAP